MVVYTHNPRTLQAETRGWQDRGQARLHIKTLSQTNEQRKSQGNYEKTKLYITVMLLK
jgi:hypothetical protein